MNAVLWTTFTVIMLIIHCPVGSCSKNFALNKSANQSSTLTWNGFQWTADKAVDGNTSGENPDESKTCSATDTHPSTHFWVVDIGFLIIVKTITVYKRNNAEDDQLYGFRVYIGNTSKPWTENRPLAQVQPVNTQYTFRVNDSLARFVSVRRLNRNIMTICEVIVDGECQKGTFGDRCNEICGKCLNGNYSCNSTTGHCADGCQKGWSGETCKEGCKIGAYGYGCNESCGMCFNGNNSCSVIDGQCKLGCIAGWQGETCKQGCHKGAYGYGCNETCGMCFNGNNNCSAIDGQCKQGCMAGWQGDTCKEECSNGTYGHGCNETCGWCFSGNNSCSKINGQCMFGCEAGWRGTTCNHECDKGTYGYGCNETCGMCYRGNNSCSRFDGQCSVGCEPGWQGGTCNQECDKGTYGYGCNETCGMCYSGNNSCSRFDGQCNVGCEAGWQGRTCKQGCKKGTYGHGCNETCGRCMNGVESCSTMNGRCIDGCEDGWKNEKCTLEMKLIPHSPDNVILIGVVIPVVIVFITVTIVLVVLGIRRRQSNLNKEIPSMSKEGQNVFQQVIQEGESSDRKVQEIEDTIFHKDNVYQNTEKRTLLMSQGIPVLSFWGYIMKKKANKEEFELEFQEFSKGLTKTHQEALKNPSKNRYKSIYPYDFNRVVLKRETIDDLEYDTDVDYINASHIKGFEGRKCYIAAQGPINKTVGDFWWLVWQERIECIVMLTNLNEMGKMKCVQYWPDMEEDMYGDVTVKFLRNESFDDFIERDFQLTVSGKSRKVTQFHYTAWPDKNVPDTAWSLVEFWKSVRKHKSYGKGPMLVHCSAGVGRTGTFIALDIIYDETLDTGHVAVKKCVENLREQRVSMVQTANQYIFLHEVVAETFGFGTMPVFKKQFSDVLRHLMEEDEGSGLTHLQRQYNMLKKINIEQEENILPVYSNAEGVVSDFIWLPNLSGRDAYIAVKRVKDETLLSTIVEKNIKCLINVDNSRPKDALFSIGVDRSKTVAGVDITCEKNEDLGAFERNQFSITSQERKQPHKLTMFFLKTWKESNEVPSDSNYVMSLLEDISQYNPSPSELSPVLLYTRLELNRCSLIYILLNEKDRIRRDGEIHILQTSAKMLERNLKLMPTFDQYSFLYKCLSTDSLRESTYENAAGIKRNIVSP